MVVEDGEARTRNDQAVAVVKEDKSFGKAAPGIAVLHTYSSWKQTVNIFM